MRPVDADNRPVGGWRRVWCVLQDSALSFFEHERAAVDGLTAPVETFEWQGRHRFPLSL